MCRTSWPGTFAQKRENEGRRSNGLLSVTQKSVAQVENHPWWCLPSPCHHSSPGFSSHYWICRLLSDSVTQLCPHPARPRHSQAGNPAGNPDRGAALTQSCSSELLRRFSGSCLQQNQWSSSISSNFCSHWLLQMVVLSQYKLSRCLNAHSLFFFGFYFYLLILLLVRTTTALGWELLRPFTALLAAPQGNLYLRISPEAAGKKFHFPKIPPTSSSLRVPLTAAVYAVNWNGVCFILNNLVIDWGGGQRDSRVIYIPVHGAVISGSLSTAFFLFFLTFFSPLKNYSALSVHVCIHL